MKLILLIVAAVFITVFVGHLFAAGRSKEEQADLDNEQAEALKRRSRN